MLAGGTNPIHPCSKQPGSLPSRTASSRLLCKAGAGGGGHVCMGLRTPKEKPSRMQTQHKEMALFPALRSARPCQVASPGPAGTRGLQEQLEISNRMTRSPLPGPIHCQTLLWCPALGGNSLALPSAKAPPQQGPPMAKGAGGGRRDPHRAPGKGRKGSEKAEPAESNPLLPQNTLINSSPPANAQSLDPPPLSPHCSSIREQDGKAAPQ